MPAILPPARAHSARAGGRDAQPAAAAATASGCGRRERAFVRAPCAAAARRPPWALHEPASASEPDGLAVIAAGGRPDSWHGWRLTAVTRHRRSRDPASRPPRRAPYAVQHGEPRDLRATRGRRGGRTVIRRARTGGPPARGSREPAVVAARARPAAAPSGGRRVGACAGACGAAARARSVTTGSARPKGFATGAAPDSGRAATTVPPTSATRQSPAGAALPVQHGEARDLGRGARKPADRDGVLEPPGP